MPNKGYLLLVALLLAIGVVPVRADTVILKSGEMFQTSKAWKENGVVSYYRDGRVVRVAEQDVERVIHSQAPAEKPPQSSPPSTAQPPASKDATALDRSPAPRQPADQDAGYLGLKWGQPPSQIDGLVLVETDPAYGGVKQYSRPKSKKRFGRARVDSIYYGFWQGGLYTILIEVSNPLDYMDLKAEAFRRFGEVSSEGDNPEKYRWKSGGTDRQLAYDYQSGAGYLWMRSQALHAKVKARYPE